MMVIDKEDFGLHEGTGDGTGEDGETCFFRMNAGFTKEKWMEEGECGGVLERN